MGTLNRFGIVMVVLAVGLLAGCAGARAEEERVLPPRSVKEIDVGPAPFAAEPPLAVKLWADRENYRYRVGEKVTFFVEATRDCFLTLLNVGTSGQVKVLFPNTFQKANAVRATAAHAIPGQAAAFEFTLAGPPGVEGVMAICALDYLSLAPGTGTESGQPPYPGSGRPIATPKDIEVQLKPIPKDRWATATISLDVEPGDRKGLN